MYNWMPILHWMATYKSMAVDSFEYLLLKLIFSNLSILNPEFFLKIKTSKQLVVMRIQLLDDKGLSESMICQPIEFHQERNSKLHILP